MSTIVASLPLAEPASRRRTRPPRRVEVRRRLVEDEHLGPRRQHPGDREALLLAARQAVRPTALEAVEARPRRAPRARGPHRVERPGAVLEAERDVVLDSLHDQLAGRILEDEADVPRRPRPRSATRGVDAVDA